MVREPAGRLAPIGRARALCREVHGGGGMCDDFPLAHAYASARTLRFADGPDEVHRMVVARQALRCYRKGEAWNFAS